MQKDKRKKFESDLTNLLMAHGANATWAIRAAGKLGTALSEHVARTSMPQIKRFLFLNEGRILVHIHRTIEADPQVLMRENLGFPLNGELTESQKKELKAWEHTPPRLDSKGKPFVNIHGYAVHIWTRKKKRIYVSSDPVITTRTTTVLRKKAKTDEDLKAVGITQEDIDKLRAAGLI